MRDAIRSRAGEALSEEELLEVLQRNCPDREATLETVRTYAAVLEATGDAYPTPIGWRSCDIV